MSGLASQAFSSISNFLLVVAVARASPPAAFGAFAVALSATWLLHGLIRAFVGETLSVSLPRGRQRGQATAAALGAAALLGGVGAVVLMVLAVTWPDDLLSRWFLLFGFGLPLLAVQDAGRFAGFATRRPHLAVRSDAAWLLAQLLGWLALGAVGEISGEGLFAVWCVAAGLGALTVTGATGRPDLFGGSSWLRTNARRGGSFAAEALLAMAAGQATVYAVGFVSGLPAAGALRGGQSLYGPLRSLALGARSIALPEATHRYTQMGPRALMRYCSAATAALSALGALGAVVLSLLPHRLGQALLADTWPRAESIMPALGLSLIGMLLGTGAHLGLRALQADRTSLILRALAALVGLGAGVGGAVHGGLLPAAYGLGGAHLVSNIGAWFAFRRLARVAGGTAINQRLGARQPDA